MRKGADLPADIWSAASVILCLLFSSSLIIAPLSSEVARRCPLCHAARPLGLHVGVGEVPILKNSGQEPILFAMARRPQSRWAE